MLKISSTTEPVPTGRPHEAETEELRQAILASLSSETNSSISVADHPDGAGNEAKRLKIKLRQLASKMGYGMSVGFNPEVGAVIFKASRQVRVLSQNTVPVDVPAEANSPDDDTGPGDGHVPGGNGGNGKKTTPASTPTTPRKRNGRRPTQPEKTPTAA